MINLKTFKLDEVITLSTETLSIYIDKFWSEVFDENKDNHLFLLCKVQFSDSDQGYRTLGQLVKINYEDKKLFLEYLSERLTILNDSYVTLPISQLTFSYIIKPGKCLDENRTLLMKDYSDKDLGVHSFNNMNLPITMDPHKYGEVRLFNIIEDNGSSFVRYIVVNNSKTFQIDIYNEGMLNKVTILGNINLSWVDTRINLESSELFKREIKKINYLLYGWRNYFKKKRVTCKGI